MASILKNAKELYPFRELRYLYSDQRTPDAVQMHIDDFLGLMETLQIIADKKIMRSIERGIQDIKENRLHTHEEVFG